MWPSKNKTETVTNQKEEITLLRFNARRQKIKQTIHGLLTQHD